MGSIKDYEAKLIRSRISGFNLPSIEEITKDIINSNGILKKEEIDEIVCKKIGFPMDESISSTTSVILKKLEAEKIADHVAHGYWKKY